MAFGAGAIQPAHVPGGPPAVQCNAKSKRSGEQCKAWAVAGKTKCRMHGGNNTGRPIIHGRYSQHLPQRLQARYDQAEADGDLIALNGEIAALEVRLGEILEGLDVKAPAEAWKQAQKLFADATNPQNAGQGSALQELGRILEKGVREAYAWEEFAQLADVKRKLHDTELKRRQALEQFITVKESQALGAALLNVVRKHVSDPTIRDRIALELVSLLGHQPGAGTGE
jgi:hypothetical protein